MTILLILAGLALGPTAQAAENNCFFAQGTYLVVDGSGQNMVLELKGEDCKNLSIAYGTRDPKSKLRIKLQAGGWKPFPKIEGPLPMEPKGTYQLVWEERRISLNAQVEQEEGVQCTMNMHFGYDSYIPETSSFKLKTISQCTGEEQKESEVTLYGF